MNALLAKAFRASLVLFPGEFRRAYGAEMAEIFGARIRHVTGAMALRVTARELCDVALAALRVRLDAAPRARPAFVAGMAMTLVVSWLAVRSGGQWSAPLAVQTDSIDFNASDPAGEFTIAIRKGRLVAASIDRMPLPRHRVVQSGDSIRFLAPGGGVVLAVAYYRERARIEWEARPQACRGRANSCVGYQ